MTADGPALQVLIVEDKTDTAECLALFLRMDGHATRVAGDGPAAPRAVRDAVPDAVLLDIGLPGGMDGWEVARRLRTEHPRGRLLLVAVTGYGRPEDRARSAKVGVDVHLVKPADPEAILQLLRGHAHRLRTDTAGGCR
jgi:CheY-like chemotaxis protein